MEKYFKRKSELELPPPPPPPTKRVDNSSSSTKRVDNSSSKQDRVEINLADLPSDPGLRPRITDYHPNDRDQVRRAYVQRKARQPKEHNFPYKAYGANNRRFNKSWFTRFDWLEYSIAKDAAFCLYCYLFKRDVGEQAGGDTFVTEGFSNWKCPEKLRIHEGGINSSHNQARRMFEDLLKPNQSIQSFHFKQTDQARIEYRTRLNASVDCIRFLLRQGLAFRDHNEDIKAVTLRNAPENNMMISPAIQKDIVSAAAVETSNAIIMELGDAFFSVLIDESRDISTKEQMAVALRYVDKKGHVVERFLGIEHVTDTTALSLKAAVEDLFCRHGLSLSRLRGQGYDGASNMQGQFNGLKTLIMKENESAYYVHCFAHQLQLALVAVAKNNNKIATFFNFVANVVNIAGGSCKRLDLLKEKQATRVVESVHNGELPSGQGLNQETSLKRSCDTRWSSHYNTMISLIDMFPSIVDVLDAVAEDGSTSELRGQAEHLSHFIQSFGFVFNLHLMRYILGVSNELSQALQRKDQDIVNAMKLVRISKERLQIMRENGWSSLLDEVSTFCGINKILVPDMDDIYVARGRSRRYTDGMTNLHFYRVELFYAIIDMQLQELNNRFTESNTELLLCVSCLSPSDFFATFDKQKLIRLAQFYPEDFSSSELMILSDQLDNYIFDVRSSIEFSKLEGICDLAQKMVETKKNVVYPLVYLLVTLALTLPVATATVERAFSAMKIVKNRLRSRMSDQWMNDSLIVYIEKDIFHSIDNEAIMQRFQNMKTRRNQL
uniref:TTF-type domain-containing protein n=1 Tax=Fagus sylvatica TaxID=28930 RepID=A0A2N9GA43_FAGSY